MGLKLTVAFGERREVRWLIAIGREVTVAFGDGAGGKVACGNGAGGEGGFWRWGGR